MEVEGKGSAALAAVRLEVGQANRARAAATMVAAARVAVASVEAGPAEVAMEVVETAVEALLVAAAAGRPENAHISKLILTSCNGNRYL